MTVRHRAIPAATILGALAVCAPCALAQQKSLPKIGAPTPGLPTPPVGTGACSAATPSCADVAPTILKSALGPSPLGDDLRDLDSVAHHPTTGSLAEERAERWAVEAFRKAGVEQVHLEPYGSPSKPTTKARGSFQPANVVAEIRGREKPSEFVILAARLDAGDNGTASIGSACGAALVIDAARAIHAAGTRPLRSIRFILFTGGEKGISGSWAYARTHRADLDRADAAIIYEGDCGKVTGYDLEGRPELEPRLHEALTPAAQLGAGRDVDRVALVNDGFDFLLEGVPTLVARFAPLPSGSPLGRTDSPTLDGTQIETLKHAEALAAVSAYAIADFPQRLGPRQTRTQIQALLARNHLEAPMKALGIWKLWEQGARGRRP